MIRIIFLFYVRFFFFVFFSFFSRPPLTFLGLLLFISVCTRIDRQANEWRRDFQCREVSLQWLNRRRTHPPDIKTFKSLLKIWKYNGVDKDNNSKYFSYFCFITKSYSWSFYGEWKCSCTVFAFFIALLHSFTSISVAHSCLCTLSLALSRSLQVFTLMMEHR